MKKFKFQLDKNDIDFLEKNISVDSAIIGFRAAKERGAIIIKEKYTTDKYNLILSAETVSKILDELGDLLSLKGLDDNSEPNSFGRRIEGLIDIFSVCYDE